MRRISIAFFVCLFAVAGYSGPLLLRFKAGTVNPEKAFNLKTRESRFFIAKYPKGRIRLHIVQFDGPVTGDARAILEKAGCRVVDYVPDFAYAVFATPEVMQKLHLKHLRWKGIFQPEYRISPDVLRENKAGIKGTVQDRELTLQIQFYPISDAAVVRYRLQDAGADIIKWSESEWQQSAIIKLKKSQLENLAVLPGLKWIEKYRKPVFYSKKPEVALKLRKRPQNELKNQHAGSIMDMSALWTAGYTGNGQIVGICDTGLDKGSLSDIHADFDNDDNSSTNTTRLVAAYALGRTNDWSDTDSHGTHTAGSIVGDGSHSAGNFKGTAYEARLVEQSVLDSNGGLGGIPNDLNDLFQQAYDDGARVHSNSWGLPLSSGGYVYDSEAVEVDQFMWNHKDFLILFAAGNDGSDGNSDGVVDLRSVTAPGTAKNCITVGATESDIDDDTGTWGAYWSSDFPADPIKSDGVDEDPDGMAAFSSRGPAPDNRIKPEISAPGTMIISTRSQASGAGTGWGVYDDWYLYDGGTSMATPLTSGAAVVTRDFFVNHESVTPSAALIKATMMNGAYDMYPGQYGTGATQEQPTLRPNSVEGWGRVKLSETLMPASPVQLSYVDETTGLNTGDVAAYQIVISDTSKPMKITLTWTDYPGAASASVELVNDLDLTVQTPSGTTLYPNHGTSADRVNNSETIDVPAPVSGTYIVRVTGYNVPQGPQPFALVAHATAAIAPYTDTTPPVISNISLCVASDQCVVTWDTDEPADSVVTYGTNNPPASTTSDAALVTGHSITLTGLTASTLYYFKVGSTDSASNASESDIYTFTTNTTPANSIPFSDDMESGTGNWTTTLASGSTDWALNGSYVHSSSNAWYSQDEASVKDDYLETSAIDLTSVVSATLSFWHTYEMENGYDGCVIEISTDGGNNFSDLGNDITSGGYTGTISTSFSSPIAGRSAWTGGTLGSMSEVTVDLTPYVGNNVIIRFRLACDSSQSSQGWYVDDVTVTASSCTETTPAPVSTTHTITASAGSGGSISPAGNVTVNDGADQAFTITATTGYHISDVTVDSTSVGAVSSYTFTNVTADHTISASFAVNTYTLAGANGTISGTTPQTVNYGADGSAVTAVPATGYHFVNWSDGSTANPRTDTSVTADISVTANFAVNTYTLTYTAGANGTISGTTPQTVN
ncbi:MAG: S8 family serine peptidase, partial [Acidobacteria bacterium]|nr:S8 family serine peptidase [Acidobacteriota bacterium]